MNNNASSSSSSAPPLADIARSHREGVLRRDEALGVNILGKGTRELGWLYNAVESFYENDVRGLLFSCLNLYFVNEYGETDMVQYPFLPYFLLRVNCDESEMLVVNVNSHIIYGGNSMETKQENLNSNIPAHVQTLITTLMQLFPTQIFCINVIYKDSLGDVSSLSKEPVMYLKVSFLLQKEMKKPLPR